ncbi:MAG: 50S ribosomal protein L18 [Candidatus Thermoplasmatota archaeon]|nr:50S ribosomal protein L18 [Candidatus Thermoplasmatota archaeon]
MIKATYRVKFKRRREGKTDYRKRLALLKSNLPRAVVRKTLTNSIIQIIEYTAIGDRVVASATAHELKKLGWSANTDTLPAGYLTGLLAGKRARAKKVTQATLDIGLRTASKGAHVFACLKGLLDAGLEIPHSKNMLPSEDRIKGKHIKEGLETLFDEVRAKIEEEVLN